MVELINEDFQQLFRDPAAGRRAFVVPNVRGDKASIKHVLRWLGVPDRLWSNMKFERRDGSPPFDGPWLPIRFWIAPKSVGLNMEQLIELWAEHGYRPLTLDEQAAVERCLWTMNRYGVLPFLDYPRVFTGLLARTIQSPLPHDLGHLLQMRTGLGSRSRTVVPEFVTRWADDSFTDDVLFPLISRKAKPRDIAVPEGHDHSTGFLIDIPEHW